MARNTLPRPITCSPERASTSKTKNRPRYSVNFAHATTVAPVPTVDDTYINNAVPAVGAAYPIYRYVYEPDRILVIDPATNVAIQSIPR